MFYVLQETSEKDHDNSAGDRNDNKQQPRNRDVESQGVELGPIALSFGRSTAVTEGTPLVY